jgi:hypothetical protein
MKVCKRGHVDPPRNKNRSCVLCARVLALESYYKHHSRRLVGMARWRNENKDKASQCRQKWIEQNRDRVRKNKKEWQKKNRERVLASDAAYGAAKLQATPSWADKDLILSVYLNCPSGLEVDHVVPLRGKTVCGLHVPWNLQYLTRRENISKGNRFVDHSL